MSLGERRWEGRKTVPRITSYVKLRSTFKLQTTCGVIEQRVNVVSSVSTITVGPLLNLIKQRPVGCLIGPKEFYLNAKLI
jgi:hypothetical protein